MSSEGPIRFYAVSHGSYDDYCEFYILATSHEDALRRYLRSTEQPYYNVVGTVWEADIDSCGLIRKTKELYSLELPGQKGYLWARGPGEEDIDAKYGIVRCLLCGNSVPGEGENPPTAEDVKKFLNDDKKCAECAVYKVYKL